MAVYDYGGTEKCLLSVTNFWSIGMDANSYNVDRNIANHTDKTILENDDLLNAALSSANTIRFNFINYNYQTLFNKEVERENYGSNGKDDYYDIYINYPTNFAYPIDNTFIGGSTSNVLSDLNMTYNSKLDYNLVNDSFICVNITQYQNSKYFVPNSLTNKTISKDTLGDFTISFNPESHPTNIPEVLTDQSLWDLTSDYGSNSINKISSKYSIQESMFDDILSYPIYIKEYVYDIDTEYDKTSYYNYPKEHIPVDDGYGSFGAATELTFDLKFSTLGVLFTKDILNTPATPTISTDKHISVVNPTNHNSSFTYQYSMDNINWTTLSIETETELLNTLEIPLNLYYTDNTIYWRVKANYNKYLIDETSSKSKFIYIDKYSDYKTAVRSFYDSSDSKYVNTFVYVAYDDSAYSSTLSYQNTLPAPTITEDNDDYDLNKTHIEITPVTDATGYEYVSYKIDSAATTEPSATKPTETPTSSGIGVNTTAADGSIWTVTATTIPKTWESAVKFEWDIFGVPGGDYDVTGGDPTGTSSTYLPSATSAPNSTIGRVVDYSLNIAYYKIKLGTTTYAWTLVQATPSYDTDLIIDAYPDFITLYDTYASNYKRYIASPDTTTTQSLGTNTSFTLTVPEPDKKEIVFVRAYYNDAKGDWGYKVYETDKVNAPQNVSFYQRTKINEGIIKWEAPSNLDNINNVEYHYTITKASTGDIVQVDTSAGINYQATIGNLPLEDIKVTMYTKYTEDIDYNSSETVTTLSATNWPKLATPTLTTQENSEIVEGVSGVTSVTLSLDTYSTLFKNAANSKFVITDSRYYFDIVNDEYVTDVTYDEEPTTFKDKIYTSSNLDVGIHSITIQAIFSDDEDYNSDISAVTTLEINTTGTVNDLQWDTTIDPNNSTLKWSTPTINPPDYYSVEMLPSEGDLEQTFTTNNSIDVTNQYLVINPPNEETVYDCYVIGYNYDRFYKRPSHASDIVNYTIHKNEYPTNLVWDSATNTLSWTGDSNSNYYTIYESGISTPIGYSETESFTNVFDVNLHTVYVKGSTRYMISDVDYMSVQNPRWIKSDSSATITFGTLPIPVVERNNQYLQWVRPDVNEEYNIVYVIYDGTTLIKDNETSTQFEMPFQSVGTHNYKVKATTTVAGDLYESAYSTPSTSDGTIFTVSQIADPVISFNPNTCELFFDAVSNATYYNLYIDGNITRLDNVYTSGSPYIIPKTEPGTYNIYLQAKNTDTFLFLSSGQSNTLTYEIFKLATPSVSYDSGTGDISWSAIANATDYDVYLNSSFYINVATNSYTFSLPAGSYGTYINAKHTHTISNPNPLYLDSNVSNSITFGVLDVPVLTLTNNVLTWPEIENSDYYEVYNNSELVTVVYDPIYNIYADEPESFSIYVWAKSNSDTMDDSSSYSTTESYIVSQLSTPSINLTGTLSLEWADMLHADYYDVYLNGEVISSSTGTSFNMINSLSVGSNEIYVIARSDFYKYLDSEISNIVKYTKESTQQYIAKIDGEVYEVWLPFNFLETVDDTLDSADLILAPINKNTPFEIDTEIEIIVYGDDLDTILSPSPYHMIISKDEVIEVQQGVTSKWKHKLTLIERTKLLQYIIMPDNSSTQPLDYIKAKNKNVVTPDTGDNYLFLKNEILSIPVSEPSIYREYSGLHVGFSSLYEKNLINTIVKLPIEYGSEYTMTNKDISNTNTSILSQYTGSVTKKYYYRKYDSTYTTYDYEKTTNEVLIATVKGNLSAYWYPQYTGVYDIILEIERDEDPNIPDPYDGAFELEFMRSSKPIGVDNFEPYRVVWSNVQINESDTTVEDTEAKFLDKELQRLCNIIEPLQYRFGAQLNSNYSIDRKILDKTENIVTPESKFENGKSLYEILTQYGRELYGIPRLLPNNIITYDIMKDNIVGNTLFTDSTELMITNTNEEYHHTGFISNVNNMISKNNYNVYPFGDTYIRPRSQSEDDPYVTRSNMCIDTTIDLNRLVKLEVSNFIESSPTTKADITAYVNEKTIFDSLNSNAEGKGLSLYFNDGDSKIYGLGIIPEANELYTALGWSDTDYVIEKILLDAGYVSTNNVNEFKYKVWYKDIISSRIYNEKSNIAGLKNNSYKVFNQEDNTVSDTNFGKSISTQLERLGNNDIQKTYRIYDYTKIPYLGQLKIYEEEKYYADRIAYTINNGYIDVTVNYTKNINKINERKGVDSDYRFYEFKQSDYVTRDININNYCYISTDLYEVDDNYNCGYINKMFKYSLQGDGIYADPNTVPNSLYVKIYNDDHNQLTYIPYDSEDDGLVPAILLPVSYRTFKNNILLSSSFKTNYSAGISAKIKDDSSSIPTLQYIQKDIRYVGYDGGNNYMDFTICSPTEEQITLRDGTDISKSLPEAKYHTSIYTNLDDIYYTGEYLIDKNNRERLRFNHQLHFKTYDTKINTGSGLTEYIFKNPSYDDNATVTQRYSPIFCLYIGDVSGKDSLESNVILECSSPVITYSSAATPVGMYTKLATQTVTNISKEYNGVALIWPDTKEILFTYDIDIDTTSYVIPDFYFKFTDKQIEYQEN